MSQRFSLYEQLTVDQNIRFFGGMYGLESKRLDARRAFVLEMAGLRGREKMQAFDSPAVGVSAWRSAAPSSTSHRSSSWTSRQAASTRSHDASSGISSIVFRPPARPCS